MKCLPKFTLIMIFKLFVFMNIGNAQKSAAEFLKETFEYIYDGNMWTFTLSDAKEEFLRRNSRDWRDTRLMGEITDICSQSLIQQINRPPQVYMTRTVVACHFLNYIKESEPFWQPLMDANIGDLFDVGRALYFAPRNHPEKDMRRMLQEDMRAIMVGHIHPLDFQQFFHRCTQIISHRWEQRMYLVMPCCMVTNYHMILFNAQEGM